MHPILFELPGVGFPIRSFGVLLAAGFILGTTLWPRLVQRFGDDPERDPERVSQVAIWLLVGVVGGARLFYVGVESAKYLAADISPAVARYLEAGEERGSVATQMRTENPEELETASNLASGYDFLHDPLQILMVWRGGLVMYGGMFGAIALGLWSSRKHQLRPSNAFDTGLTAGFFGQGVGRIGCLLVGDDYGSVVPEQYQDLPWILVYQVPEVLKPESLFGDELAGKFLWNTQMWMSLNAICLGFLGVWLLKRRRYAGQVGLWLVAAYSVTRSIIESFRGDNVRGMWAGGLSTSQLISIPALLVALALLFVWRRRKDAPGVEQAEPEASGG